jgi:hypothetical protein
VNSLKERWIGFRWRMKHSLDKNALAGRLSVRWPGYKSWIAMNWLPILLILATFITGLRLALGYGLVGQQFIYWWVMQPAYYQIVVDLVCVIGLVVTLLLRNVRWYVRVLVVIPFLVMLPVSFVQVFRLNFLTYPEHVSSVTFQNHVYHMSFTPPFSTPYATFTLYECDSMGWWCHVVERVSAPIEGRQSAVLVANDESNTLSIVSTDHALSGDGVIRQYVGAGGVIAAQPTPTAP